MRAFESFLRAEVQARGWRQSDLAAAADLPMQTVNNLWNGRVDQPTMPTLAKIANALDISVEVLAEKLGHPRSHPGRRPDPRALREVEREIAVLSTLKEELAQHPQIIKDASRQVKNRLLELTPAVAGIAARGKRRA